MILFYVVHLHISILIKHHTKKFLMQLYILLSSCPPPPIVLLVCTGDAEDLNWIWRDPTPFPSTPRGGKDPTGPVSQKVFPVTSIPLKICILEIIQMNWTPWQTAFNIWNVEIKFGNWSGSESTQTGHISGHFGSIWNLPCPFPPSPILATDENDRPIKINSAVSSLGWHVLKFEQWGVSN